MKKIMVILPILMVMAIATATSAFAVSQTVTVNASVQQGTASIAVVNAVTGGTTVTTMAFPAITNTSGQNRKASTTPATAYLQYFSGGGTYEVRAWFDNYTGNQIPTAVPRGLKTTVSAVDYYWPLKIWCANFGPAGVDAVTGPVPNPQTDVYWKGTAPAYSDAAWKWVLERAHKVDGFGLNTVVGYPTGSYKTDTRCTLTWYYPSGTSLPTGATADGRMPGTFLISLGIDGLDAQYAAGTATSYTGTLTLDLTQTP